MLWKSIEFQRKSRFDLYFGKTFTWLYYIHICIKLIQVTLSINKWESLVSSIFYFSNEPSRLEKLSLCKCEWDIQSVINNLSNLFLSMVQIDQYFMSFMSMNFDLYKVFFYHSTQKSISFYHSHPFYVIYVHYNPIFRGWTFSLLSGLLDGVIDCDWQISIEYRKFKLFNTE